jgi:hypothetical protein
MTKVHIYYNLDSYVDKFDRKTTECEAYLRWHPVAGDEGSEILVARAYTFPEAREQVIAMFRRIPATEEIEI